MTSLNGIRLLACRGPAGIRLLTRNGSDFTARYPLIVEAVEALPASSCVIDGEAVACDGAGLSIFENLRWRHHDGRVFLWSFAGWLAVQRAYHGAGRYRPPARLQARPGGYRLEAGWGRFTSPAARATGSSSRTAMRPR
jgi:hypothetical protein